MKHQTKITAILLMMFVMTQLIGLLVIDAYTPQKSISVGEINKTIGQNVTIPYGMEPPELKTSFDFWSMLPQFLISLAIAIFVLFLLMKLKARSLIVIWFTFVVFLTTSIALTAILSKIFPASNIRLDMVALIIAIPLTFYKIFRRNVLVHNATELLIYPGLAAIFVPILNVWTVLILLILISVYDIWAVWKSSFMMNMAKFEMQHLKTFSGFMIPYIPKNEMLKLKQAQKIKTQRAKIAKLKKIKISMAILGGGDVAFPLIFAGVMYKQGGLVPALFIVAGAAISLLLLLLFSKKGRMYPAMPYITTGCIIAWLLTLILL